MLRRTYALHIPVAIGMLLFIGGCASLFQPLPKRIKATHLSCEMYPSLVDGDLSTNSFLKVTRLC